MPVGEYEVTFDEKWSWRYDKLTNTTATVQVEVGGELVIDLTPRDDKWLTSDSVGTCDITKNNP